MAKSKKQSKKRNNRNVIEEVITSENGFMNKFYIAAGVILFLLCFYILTVYITNKNNTETDILHVLWQ